MASMSYKERAEFYYKRILKSENKLFEIKKILSEIDKLVYSENKKLLNKSDKDLILSELSKLLKRSSIILEDTDFSRKSEYLRKSKRIVSSTDNSEILSLVAAIEAKRKESK